MPRDPAPIPPALKPFVPEPIARLALRPLEAAKALGVCERTLRALPGVPRLKLNGGTVLYPVAALERWLADRLERGPEADATSAPAVAPTSEGDADGL